MSEQYDSRIIDGLDVDMNPVAAELTPYSNCFSRSTSGTGQAALVEQFDPDVHAVRRRQ